jgi:methionyl-tRNA formyltransferase
VARWADERGLPVFQPRRPSEPEFLEALAELAPDCCPIVAYGGLIPAVALAVPPRGWVNLHFSLLPAWRGAAPVQRSIMAGDEVTGASTFLLEQGLDTGPLYGLLTERIKPTDTAGDLLGRLAVAGAGLLVATLDGIEDGGLRAEPQVADGVSLAPKVTSDDARVVWGLPAHVVDRRIRGCTPAPGAWTTWREQRVKLGPVHAFSPADALIEGAKPGPGELVVQRVDGGQRVLAGTTTGPVVLSTVQPPGKAAMPAADWARGARPQPGERFA